MNEHEALSRGLVSFALGYVITETWPDNNWLSEYNTCDASCDLGDEDCGCTCNEDPYELADEVVSQSCGLFIDCMWYLLVFSRFKCCGTFGCGCGEDPEQSEVYRQCY